MVFALELAQIAAALFAAIGLIFTGFQISQSNKQHRISRVDDARKEFYSNKMIQDLYYKIEYDKFFYTDDFQESEEEKTLDYMLGIFDSLAKQIVRILVIMNTDSGHREHFPCPHIGFRLFYL